MPSGRLMDLIQESFQRLFPSQEFPYRTKMEYNRRLGDFNANIKLSRNTIFLNLNLQWKDIDPEIKIGLIQSLLLKILKKKAQTINIELYNNFVRNIPVLTPRTQSDPLLEESFRRVRGKFFSPDLEQPNLAWGTDSSHKLASYNFHEDKVTVSTLFKEVKPEILDYLMYHELLHKHHQFQQRNGRSSFHGREFRKAEALYPQKREIDQEINQFVREKKLRSLKQSLFRFWG